MYAQVQACMRMNHGRACRLILACTYRRFLWPLLSKNKFYLLIKIYIFHFNISQVNLTSDWALNRPWVLEFKHHWGMKALVVRGTKCGVYRCLFFLICELRYRNQKNKRQNILFRCTAQAQPMHTTHITHTWGGVQHRRALWDSYVRIPTFVA